MPNFFQTKNYDFPKCQHSDLLTVSWTLLKNYPDKSDIIGLINTTVCWKLGFIVCYAQEKSYGLQTSFLEVFFTLLENYRAKSQVKCSIEKTDFLDLLYFTGHPFFEKIRFLKSPIFKILSLVPHQYNKFNTYQTRTSSFRWPLSVFHLYIRKFWFT